MNRLILACFILFNPLVANALLITENYNLADFQSFDYEVPSNGVLAQYQRPEIFTNNWQTTWGDTAGYVSFEAFTQFRASMYLMEFNYDCQGEGYCGSFGDVIAYGQPTGDYGYGGYNQRIEGFLDRIPGWSGYAVLVLPEEMPLEDVYNYDFSYLNDWAFQPNDTYYNNPEYLLRATVPYYDGTNLYPTRPEGVVTLNEQYLARVSEPLTASMLLLAMGGFIAVRKRK